MEVLGDHYLYPTYLPEAAERSEHVSMGSSFNAGSRNRESDELFFGYFVRFHSGGRNDTISIGASDSERRNVVFDNWPRVPDYAEREQRLLEEMFSERIQFNEHIVTIGGVDITFNSLYEVHRPRPPANPYHPQNRRTVYYAFTIDTVTYTMTWVQFDVEDKYADDELHEAMLRVATSIIEQVRKVE